MCTLLYNVCTIKSPMLTTLSAIAVQQANPIKATIKKVKHFLDCCAPHDGDVDVQKEHMVSGMNSNAGY